MRQSLPQLDGTANALGARQAKPPSSATRAASRSSPPRRAPTSPMRLGYAHGQDRFFQMDLSRRLAAGELSELFGAVALKQDRRTRRFGFRAVARRVIEATPGERARDHRGLHARRERGPRASLKARPWEYLLLRAQPRAWPPEDSVLVVHSMWWQLQYGTLRDEIDRRRLERAAAARSDAGRSARRSSPSSTPATPTGTRLTIPPSRRACRRPAPTAARVLTQSFPGAVALRRRRGRARGRAAAPGSNNWAVAGMHTRSGVALIANDMHLDLGVPAVWYPARLRVTGEPASSTSPASRCRARPRSRPVPTARWPGDSPTATAISPMRAGANARAPTIACAASTSR